MTNKENEKSKTVNLIAEPEKVIDNVKDSKFTENKQIADEQYIDDYIYELSNEGYKARALYDYQAGE